jgi:hypothetical protein
MTQRKPLQNDGKNDAQLEQIDFSVLEKPVDDEVAVLQSIPPMKEAESNDALQPLTVSQRFFLFMQATVNVPKPAPAEEDVDRYLGDFFNPPVG